MLASMEHKSEAGVAKRYLGRSGCSPKVFCFLGFGACWGWMSWLFFVPGIQKKAVLLHYFDDFFGKKKR